MMTTTTKTIKAADRTLILATIKRMIRTLDHASLHVKGDDVNTALITLTSLRSDANAIGGLLEMIRAGAIADEAATPDTRREVTLGEIDAAIAAGRQASVENPRMLIGEAWKPFTDWAVANNLTQATLSYEANHKLWKLYEMGWAAQRS